MDEQKEPNPQLVTMWRGRRVVMKDTLNPIVGIDWGTLGELGTIPSVDEPIIVETDTVSVEVK